MLIYLDDALELKAIKYGLVYYYYLNLFSNDNPQSVELASRINKLIDKIDKEIEYYDTSTQEN